MTTARKIIVVANHRKPSLRFSLIVSHLLVLAANMCNKSRNGYRLLLVWPNDETEIDNETRLELPWSSLYVFAAFSSFGLALAVPIKVST